MAPLALAAGNTAAPGPLPAPRVSAASLLSLWRSRSVAAAALAISVGFCKIVSIEMYCDKK